MLDERHLSQLDAHRARLVRAAARLLGGTAEAEDVVQDSYLRALEAGGPPVDVAEAWLTTVMRNLAIDRLRRRGWMQTWLSGFDAHALAEAPSAESDAALAEETERALHRLAARLGIADGAAVLLREVFEATYAEIAAASGKSEAACRQQLHRALMRLREREAPEEKQADADAALPLYRQALQQRDAQALFAMLQQPATRAASRSTTRGVRKPDTTCAARRRPRPCALRLSRRRSGSPALA